MEEIGYKKNAKAVIERLERLYARKAEDRIFASFQMPSGTMEEYRKIHRLGYTGYPLPAERAAFWDSLLREKVFVEDDSIPSAYLSLFECPEKVREVMDFAFDLNVRVQETLFKHTPSFQGGTFSNMAQWIPGRIVSESVDPVHMTSVEDYEKWGEPALVKMFGHFDGGILHLHSNGRHQLRTVSGLRDLKTIYLLDEKDTPPAFEILSELKKQSGNLPLIVHMEDHVFLDHLDKRQLPGGVFYLVNTGMNADEVNRTMEEVREYRL